MPFDANPQPTDEVPVSQPATPTATTPTAGVLGRARSAIGRILGRSSPATPPAKQLLVAARKVIEDPDHWIQGAYARNGRYCTMGALQAVGKRYSRSARREATDWLLKYVRGEGHHSVESFNDSVTHAEVLAMFDAAIAQA